jgi:aquaporin Z
MSLVKRTAAELLGTSWLVFGGCGAAVLSAKFPGVGVGILGVALAFGLTVVTGMYALGAVSGGHFNPAITLGLATARRFPANEVLPYWIAQLIGAVVGATVLWLIARGAPDFDVRASGLAANGFGAHSPGHYNVGASLLTEIVLTFLFVVIVLGSTDRGAYRAFAPIAVGLGLTLVNIIGIPVTNASVNPARSTGPALFAGAWALGQLWLFWVAPLVGGVLAGLAYPALMGARGGVEAPAATAETKERVMPPREPLPAR